MRELTKGYDPVTERMLEKVLAVRDGIDALDKQLDQIAIGLSTLGEKEAYCWGCYQLSTFEDSQCISCGHQAEFR